MAKSFYLPSTDNGKVIWLNTFAVKFEIQAATLGFTAADVTAVNNYAAIFSWLINMIAIFNGTKEKWVKYKNIIRSGSLGSVAGTPPELPPMPPIPSGIEAGIFSRIAHLVQRIKNNPLYTEAIGRDLNIIGAEQIIDIVGMTPALKLVVIGEHVEVQWNKGDADTIKIEKDSGNGWEFLTIDSVPHYTDTTPITAPATWKYRAIYLIADEIIGKWSPTVNITVG